jgi:hypothetical protein
MDICKGGTISVGSPSITLTNHHPEPCAITGCNMPGWPANKPVVPAEQNGIPGTLTIQLAATIPPGTYVYDASCCPGSHPTIKVQ